MKSVLVIAPHADDETLGCGGTLLRHKIEGDDIHWLLLTTMSVEAGYGPKQISSRREQIEMVAGAYGFKSTSYLGYAPASLDRISHSDLVAAIGKTIETTEAAVIYTPHDGDIHSDHRIAAAAVQATSKWFRYPSVTTILSYETLSETDFSLAPRDRFAPNYFVDITNFLEKKIEIMKVYESELDTHPFPRSETSIQALAQLHGAKIGTIAAEAFCLLKHRV